MNNREMQLNFEQKIGQFANYEFPMPYQTHHIQDLLNESQDKVAEDLYNEFERTEKLRTELNPLLRSQVFSSFVTGASFCHTNGHVVNLPTGALYPVEEKATVTYTDCNGSTASKDIRVLPVTHDEHRLNVNNPYAKPYEDLAWRMDLGSSGPTHKRHEIITDGVVILTGYTLRYIKRPTALDLINNPTGSSELDPSVHEDVVDRAVQMALASRPQLQQVQQNQES